MKIIKTSLIAENIETALEDIAFNINDNVKKKLEKAFSSEESEIGQEVLKDILVNEKIARTEKLPLCQDTGTVQIILNIGQNIFLEGDFLEDLINKSVAKIYKNSFLRKSTCNPLSRANYYNNAPASLEYNIINEDKLEIFILAKGGGCDNTSKVFMLKPGISEKNLTNTILQTIDDAGPNACPPYFIGIAIGATFESISKYSKHALLEIFSEKNPKTEFYEEELHFNKAILKKANKLGIGPLGLGGTNTVLNVNTKIYPCHIASLPLAININCHSFRFKKIIL